MRKFSLPTGQDRGLESKTDTIKNQDFVDILILTQRKTSQYPAGYKRYSVVSFNHLTQDTNLHFELEASLWCPKTDTAEQPSSYWTTSVCPFACRITCKMSPWTRVGCCLEGMVHKGDTTALLCVCFPLFSTLLLHSLHLVCWTKPIMKTLTDQLAEEKTQTHTRKCYAKCWSFLW